MSWLSVLQTAILLVALTISINFLAANDGNETIKIPKQSDYLEEANKNIFFHYNKTSFLDLRLRVLEYTILPDRKICTNITFLVVVLVRADDEDVRNSWRRIYGSRWMKEKYKYNLIFAIGKGNSSLEPQRKLEGEAYGDMVQVDYPDTYRNLTLKHLAVLRYVAYMCPEVKGIVRLNDDVSWNEEKISSFIKNNLTEDSIYCQRSHRAKAVRAGDSKWKVTYSEWNKRYYPTYCFGNVYISTITTIRKLLGVVHLEKFFWLEDVFITGVLPKASKVKIVDLPGFSSNNKLVQTFIKDLWSIIREQDPYY